MGILDKLHNGELYYAMDNIIFQNQKTYLDYAL